MPPVQRSDSDREVSEALAQILLLAEPLVAWCVQRGIGFGQFSKTLKPLFYEKAMDELARRKSRVSDSALSMVSGLHKGDILAYKLASQMPVTDQAHALRQSVMASSQQISPVHQVLVRWLVGDVQTELPIKVPTTAKFTGAPDSFTALVHSANRTTSQGFSVALVLQEMQRQGLVRVEADRVCLLAGNALSKRQIEADRHFIGAGRDLLLAMLCNLQSPDAPPFLEQSLDVDGISPASVEQLQAQFRQWWQTALQALAPQAIALNEADIQRSPSSGPGDQPTRRLRLGVYVYAEDMAPSPSATPHLSESGAQP